MSDYSFEDLKLDEAQELLAKKAEIISLCQTSLKKSFIRCDYKELVQLTLCYLGDLKLTRFNRPGALHKARFMSKLLSSIKIVMLSPLIDSCLAKNAVYTKRQLPLLERFVKFVVYVYVPWWLTAPVPAHAPSNDLALLKELKACVFPFPQGIVTQGPRKLR